MDNLSRFSTSLFEAWPKRCPKPPYRARGWSVELDSIETKESNLSAFDVSGQKDKRLRFPSSAVIGSYIDDDGVYTVVHAPEIVIRSRGRVDAQNALDLIGAAIAVWYGECYTDYLVALPLEDNDYSGLDEYDYAQLKTRRLHSAGGGYATAAAFAAKCTNKKRWTYALLKLWLSIKIYGDDWRRFDPSLGSSPYQDKNPLNFITYSQSIISAYSCIEELGLQINANSKNPSMIDGVWNPVVLQDLQNRLSSCGVDQDEKFVWVLRNTPSRVERRHPPPKGGRASWANSSIRDRLIRVEDAILYASRLRSRLSAHRVSSETKSLSPIEVHNVQMIARRLLLESLGYWRYF